MLGYFLALFFAIWGVCGWYYCMVWRKLSAGWRSNAETWEELSHGWEEQAHRWEKIALSCGFYLRELREFGGSTDD